MTALNESGHVAGRCGPLVSGAYRLAGGVVDDLGSPSDFLFITAIDANDRVLGTGGTPPGGFLVTGLDAVFLNEPRIWARGMNDLGVIVGDCSSTARSGCTVVNGVATGIGTLGGDTTSAWAINRFGQVTGQADLPRLLVDPRPFTHAFVYEQGHMFDLGTLVGRSGNSLSATRPPSFMPASHPADWRHGSARAAATSIRLAGS